MMASAAADAATLLSDAVGPPIAGALGVGRANRASVQTLRTRTAGSQGELRCGAIHKYNGNRLADSLDRADTEERSFAALRVTTRRKGNGGRRVRELQRLKPNAISTHYVVPKESVRELEIRFLSG